MWEIFLTLLLPWQLILYIQLCWFYFQNIKNKKPIQFLCLSMLPHQVEKLSILYLLDYFNSHLNCHSFSKLAFSQSILPYTNLFKPYCEQTIVMHKIFQCLLISLTAKSRVPTMTCKALHDLHPRLPPPLWPYLTLTFSSVSHQALGTGVALWFLQFTLHIVVSGPVQLLFLLSGMIFLPIFL